MGGLKGKLELIPRGFLSAADGKTKSRSMFFDLVMQATTKPSNLAGGR